MMRASHIVSLGLLGTVLLTAACSDSDKPSSATTAKPAPATTTPVTPAKTTTPTSDVKPLGSQTAPATVAGAPTAADVAKVVESLPPVPTQDDADAAAAKAISDANADAEFDKLSKEIDGDKP